MAAWMVVQVEDSGAGVDHRRVVGMAEPPALPPSVLRRGRLAEQLTSAATHRVTLVSAGPGWGKTIAVASWAVSGSAHGAVAWWSLNDADNEPRSFWSNLVSALVASGAVPNRSPLRDRRPDGTFMDVDELWVQLADLPAPIALVIDDFQVISHPDILGQFGRLIAELPPTQVRLLILTHRDPVLPLHVLRVRGDLTEIRAADLAFIPDEITELFTGNAHRLQVDQLSRILDRTEGWPAGVRAAALSINPRDADAGITRFCSADRGTADYFISEVLQAVSPRDRDFLLRTSRSEMVNGDLADRLTGRSDSQSVLTRLFEDNVFTVRRGQHGWYSYQPLFRCLLGILRDLQRPQTAGDPIVDHPTGHVSTHPHSQMFPNLVRQQQPPEGTSMPEEPAEVSFAPFNA